MTNKARLNKRKYNDKYDREFMKSFSIKIRKEIAEEIEKYIDEHNEKDEVSEKMNRNRFVTMAILEKLEKCKMNNDK